MTHTENTSATPAAPGAPAPTAPEEKQKTAVPSAPRPAIPAAPGAYRPHPAGARPPYQGGRPAFGGPGGRGRRPMMRRKVCRFCQEKVVEIDYKATPVLRSFLTPRGRMISGRTTGTCAKHQRQLTNAIKRAQNLALLPFTGE